ncbi:MAG: hypothetical protein LBP55_07360 [Candidatus Adiutrix sp.]|nr:hypothetical protein [Candidatus Adiutrix sp.]
MSRDETMFPRQALAQRLNLDCGGHLETFGPVADFKTPVGPKPRFETLLGPATSMAGRRLALMAHYDPEQLVDPYVIHYLKALRDMGYELILASQGRPALTGELKALLLAAVGRIGPGWDFASWQCAFRAWPTLFEAREILLVNDSVFGPFSPLNQIHETMSGVACDFWGLCESREIQPHLQSYYLVFRESAVKSQVFRDFWAELRASDRPQSIAAELGLTRKLAQGGLNPAAYVTSGSLPQTNISPIHYFWRPLQALFGVPFFKRDLLRGDLPMIRAKGWRELAAAGNYDVALIDRYFQRIKAAW